MFTVSFGNILLGILLLGSSTDMRVLFSPFLVSSWRTFAFNGKGNCRKKVGLTPKHRHTKKISTPGSTVPGDNYY